MKPRPPSKTKQVNKTPLGQVRIIGGQWRGRKLTVLSAQGLRPTGDRVKEMLFNWLMPHINEAYCLDLFAGSGALGFESASRGALHVTFVEKSKPVFLLLQENISLFSKELMTAINQDALNFLVNKPLKPYDIIFIDPPFHQGMVEDTLKLILNNNYLAHNGLIYLESEKNHPPINLPLQLAISKEKITGQVKSQLLRYNID